MEEVYELCDYRTAHKPIESETKSNITQTSTERRLLRIGMITLGVLCLIQASLNISLRYALYSKEDPQQLPFNSSFIAELYKVDQCQQHTKQTCICYTNLLHKLLSEYQTIKTERDFLASKLSEIDPEYINPPYSGSGWSDKFSGF